MSTDREPFEELAAGHALGALDADEFARFEAHRTAGCAACERTLVGYREALARAAGELCAPAPARVRQALLARAAERSLRRPQLRLAVAWGAG